MEKHVIPSGYQQMDNNKKEAYLRGEGNEYGNGGAYGNKKEKTQNDRRGIFLVSILK